MESRLFQALKAFKGAEGYEANLFEEFKKIAEAAFFSGYFLINGGCKDAYKLKLTCNSITTRMMAILKIK